MGPVIPIYRYSTIRTHAWAWATQQDICFLINMVMFSGICVFSLEMFPNVPHFKWNRLHIFKGSLVAVMVFAYNLCLYYGIQKWILNYNLLIDIYLYHGLSIYYCYYVCCLVCIKTRFGFQAMWQHMCTYHSGRAAAVAIFKQFRNS